MKPLLGVMMLLGSSVFLMPANAAAPAPQESPSQVGTMIDVIFAAAPAQDQVAIVLKDDADRTYLAFYRSRYADVDEVRAYSIPFRNVAQSEADQQAIDAALEAGDAAGAFDTLLRTMRLDLGAQYVSDVGLDGIHEGDVAVGDGTMRDRFHNQVFTDYAAANEAYAHWLERAVELSAS